MKIVISTLIYFNNKKTMFIYFLLRPIFNMLFVILLNYQFSEGISSKLAVAAIFSATIVQNVTLFNMSFVYDYNVGIDDIVLANNRYSKYYWLNKIKTINLISFTMILINLLLLALIFNDFTIITEHIFIIPLILFSSSIVGFVLSVSGWKNNNPYYYTNFFSAFSLILTGSITYIIYYPPVFKYLTFLFPFGHTIGLIYDQQSSWIYDSVLSLFWLFLGILIYNRKINKFIK